MMKATMQELERNARIEETIGRMPIITRTGNYQRIAEWHVDELEKQTSALREQVRVAREALKKIAHYDEEPIWNDSRGDAADLMLWKAQTALDKMGMDSKRQCSQCHNEKMVVEVIRESAPDCLRTFAHCNQCGKEWLL